MPTHPIQYCNNREHYPRMSIWTFVCLKIHNVYSKGGTGLLLLYDVMLIDFRSECRKMAKRKMITALRNAFIELNLSKVSSICICTLGTCSIY